MNNEVFYVLSFESTSHAIQTEKQIKEHFKIATIPTPREITLSCGLSIRIFSSDAEKITALLESVKVPFGLYSLSEQKVDGKREANLIFLKK